MIFGLKVKPVLEGDERKEKKEEEKKEKQLII